MPSILDAVKSVVQVGTPVLLVDSCILLDTIRCPIRKVSHQVLHSNRLFQAITETPKRCVLVVASLVPQEWADHAAEVESQLVNHLREIDEASGHVHDACAALGAPLTQARPAYAASAVSAQLRGLAQALLDQAIVLEGEDAFILRAHRRMVQGKRPARKGQTKDSIIIEEYLELCGQLTSQGSNQRRVFVSSNTDDFCIQAGGLHPDLVAEFAPLGLEFFKDISSAVSALGL